MISPPPIDPSQAVRELFGRIARRYDRMNDWQSLGLHRLWKRRVVRLAAPVPGQRAVDLCCGTGDLALRLARTGCQVWAVDFSHAMLEVAHQRLRRAGSWPNLRFIQADALQLPFPDAQFHRVTVGYGLRNLANLDRGLAEMARVTAPGGKAIALDFGQPENPFWRRLYFWYLRCGVPLLGSACAANRAAYDYILPSLQGYPLPREIAEKLRKAGFARTETRLILGGAMTLHIAVR